jgi:chromosome segregation ATPase
MITPLVAALILLGITAASYAQQPLGIISVDWNFDGAGAPPRNPELINKTIKAAFADTLKKKLNVNDPAAVADLEMMREGQNFRFVIIPKGAVQPTQDEILAVVKDSFVDNVTNFFNDFHNKEVAQIREQDEREVDFARQRAAVVQSSLGTLRARLRDMTHRVDVSPETLRGTITRVEDERDKLRLDAEAMAVRRKAVEATIAKISKTAENQIKSDRIAVELEKLVQSRETDLKRTQQLAAQNNVSQAELEASEGRLGEARVRLWERQEIVTRTAGADLLADLNKELAMLSINMAESEARLDRLSKSVSDYSKAVDLIDELESAQAARQAAQQAVIEAEARGAERMRNLRQLQPPTVNLHARQ